MENEVNTISSGDDVEYTPTQEERQSLSKDKIVPYLVPFILITVCFALWGFANDITNPLVKSFEKIFLTSTQDATLVQVAFYGGYGVMAIPAALFIRKFSYKAGVLMGLGLFSLGCFLFIPASQFGTFYPFLGVYFIITCGLSFLETTCNPYILSMGSQETATQRLNLAQAFNPIGSLTGMYIAMTFITAKMSPQTAGDRRKLSADEFESLKQSDLGILSTPYILCGVVIAIMLIVIALYKMPNNQIIDKRDLSLKGIFSRLIKSKRYREGVVAQMFYVGAQIMCWTFIIQYADNLGVSKTTAQNYNIFAMGIFLSSRFLSTFLMKYVNSRKLLALFGLGAAITILGVILIEGIIGLYLLVGASAFMSLMFPTIYGVALDGLGQDASLGAAGLVMAIVGGALMPPLQGLIIDMQSIGSFAAVNVSFLLPFICFGVVATYGFRASNKRNH